MELLNRSEYIHVTGFKDGCRIIRFGVVVDGADIQEPLTDPPPKHTHSHTVNG